MSEERLWKYETTKREQLEIDEAVKYHMSNQKKLNVNRLTMMSRVKPKVKWKTEMKLLLQDKHDQFFL